MNCSRAIHCASYIIRAIRAIPAHIRDPEPNPQFITPLHYFS